MDLSLSGYAVLTFDLFGHGYSQSAEDKKKYIDTSVGQLAELLFSLGPTTEGATTRPIHLLGVGDGAAVASAFATVHHAGSVQKLVLVAPTSGMAPVPHESVKPFVEQRIARSFTKSKSGMEELRGHLMQQDRFDSVAAITHSFSPHAVTEAYKKLGANSGVMPILTLWGDADQVSPHGKEVQLRKFMPTSQFITMTGSGHLDAFMDVEHAKVFHAVVQKFLDDELSTAEEALDLSAAKLLAKRQQKHLEAVRDAILLEGFEEEQASANDKAQTRAKLEKDESHAADDALDISKNKATFENEIDVFLAELDSNETMVVKGAEEFPVPAATTISGQDSKKKELAKTKKTKKEQPRSKKPPQQEDKRKKDGKMAKPSVPMRVPVHV